MNQPKNTETYYGTASAKKLEELQQSFDTIDILAAINAIDQIRYRICEPEGMRDELLKLHSMAYTLINSDWTCNAPNDTPIWVLAQDLEIEIAEFAETLNEIAEIIGKLGELLPEEEWEDEDEDEK